MLLDCPRYQWSERFQAKVGPSSQSIRARTIHRPSLYSYLISSATLTAMTPTGARQPPYSLTMPPFIEPRTRRHTSRRSACRSCSWLRIRSRWLRLRSCSPSSRTGTSILWYRDRTQGKLISISFKHCRGSTEVYVKELAKHLCALDYNWVESAFRHTLTAALEALCMKKEDWI